MTLTTLAGPGRAPEVPAGSAPPPVFRRPGWPLTALLVLQPLWWVLGLGTLIVFVLAVPMAVHLWRRRPVQVPPGFGLWLLFLLWVVASTVMLPVDPPGTLPDSVAGRIDIVVFNLAGYLTATVVLLYACNLTEEEFPRRRMVRQLGAFAIVVVGGGLLGTLAPSLEFTSLVEVLLPQDVAEDVFVRSLVHPATAQLQDVLGYTSPRPSAPFGFTNTWGYCLALLLGWFAVGWLGRGNPRRRAAGLLVMAVAVVPVVQSLNRGLWLALGLICVLAAGRLVVRTGPAVLGLLLAAALGAGAVASATPLPGIVQGRLDNPHSNGIRAFTTEQTLEVLAHSPVLGFGSTRAALGSSNSIAVGATQDCRRCGNPTLGSNGQVWLLLIAHGLVGTAFYVGFLLRSLWAYRRDRTPIGDAGRLALVVALFLMVIYNALVMPLILTFLSIGVLRRNQLALRAADVAGPAGFPSAAATGGHP
jgi:hypothetical protein